MHKPKIILLADDDLDDQELLEEAILQIENDATIHTVSSAKEVLVYLESCANQELPCLIILDYNMPDFTGAEVLQPLALDDRYNKIPAVVWSTSNSLVYINICKERGAKKYFRKPINFEDLTSIAKQMLHICKMKSNI